MVRPSAQCLWKGRVFDNTLHIQQPDGPHNPSVVWYVNISHHYHRAVVLILARMKNNCEELLTASQATGRPARPPLTPWRLQASAVSGYFSLYTQALRGPYSHQLFSNTRFPSQEHCFPACKNCGPAVSLFILFTKKQRAKFFFSFL